MFTLGPPMRGGITDPLFGSVKFLLSPQSMPVGSVANDQSLAGLASTVNGGAAVSNTTPLFGGPTLIFPGASDYFDYSFAPTGMNNNDFCIEAWVYLDSADFSASQVICVNNVSGSSGYIFFYVEQTTGKLVLSGTGSATTAMPTGAWVHVAVTSQLSGNTKRYFINGVFDTSSNSATAAPVSLTMLRVGNAVSGSGGGRLKGKIGGLRLTIGSRRYADGGFTVPTTAFETA